MAADLQLGRSEPDAEVQFSPLQATLKILKNGACIAFGNSWSSKVLSGISRLPSYHLNGDKWERLRHEVKEFVGWGSRRFSILLIFIDIISGTSCHSRVCSPPFYVPGT